MKTYIRDYPPADGKEYECQCARCGSSCDWTYCEVCDDGFVEEDFGDDVVPDYEVVPCETCRGHGGWYSCLSSSQWCNANPLPGREKIERGEIEWYEVKPEKKNERHD